MTRQEQDADPSNPIDVMDDERMSDLDLAEAVIRRVFGTSNVIVIDDAVPTAA